MQDLSARVDRALQDARHRQEASLCLFQDTQVAFMNAIQQINTATRESIRELRETQADAEREVRAVDDRTTTDAADGMKESSQLTKQPISIPTYGTDSYAPNRLEAGPSSIPSIPQGSAVPQGAGAAVPQESNLLEPRQPNLTLSDLSSIDGLDEPHDMRIFHFYCYV